MKKTTLVTGANGSLGKEVVGRFLESGASVIGVDLSDGPSYSLLSSQSIQWINADVTNSNAVSQLALEVGQVDYWIHCVGGFKYLLTEETRDEDFDFLMDINLRSTLYLSRLILPKMRKSGFGRIVIVGAKVSLNASAGMGPYAASKAGVNALVQSMAEEVKDCDINVNAVLPSIIDTPKNRQQMPQADFSRWVSSQALADIIYALTQPWGNPIHGACIPVSGRL